MSSKVAESAQEQDQFDTMYYINLEYPGKGNIAWDRLVTTAESQGFTTPSKSTLANLAGKIGQTMQKKNIDNIGSPCSGVIDRGYLDVGQILTNALIIAIYSNELYSSTRTQEPRPVLRGIAVCKFVTQKDGNVYLYVDVICAKDPGRLGIARMMWEKIFCLGGALREVEVINGIQLSSLTYVVPYYFGRLGFKFYNIDVTGAETLDDTANEAATALAKWRFSDDDKNFALLLQDDDENWFTYAERLTSDESGFVDIRDRSALKQLLGELNELRGVADRRATLPARKEFTKQIRDILARIHTKGEQYEDKSSPAIDFMLSARSHSVNNPGGFRMHAENPREATKADDLEDATERLDPGSQGWTMFLLGEDFDKIIGKFCGKKGGRRRRRKRRTRKKRQKKKYKKKGGDSSITKKKIQKKAREIGKEKAYEKNTREMHEQIGKLKTHFGATIKQNLPKTEKAIEKRKRQSSEFNKLLMKKDDLVTDAEAEAIRKRFGVKMGWIDPYKAEDKLLEQKRKKFAKFKKNTFQKILDDKKHPEHFNLRKTSIMGKIRKINYNICAFDRSPPYNKCAKKLAKLVNKEHLTGDELLDELEKILKKLESNKNYINELQKIQKGGKNKKTMESLMEFGAEDVIADIGEALTFAGGNCKKKSKKKNRKRKNRKKKSRKKRK